MDDDITIGGVSDLPTMLVLSEIIKQFDERGLVDKREIIRRLNVAIDVLPEIPFSNKNGDPEQDRKNVESIIKSYIRMMGSSQPFWYRGVIDNSNPDGSPDK